MDGRGILHVIVLSGAVRNSRAIRSRQLRRMRYPTRPFRVVELDRHRTALVVYQCKAEASTGTSAAFIKRQVAEGRSFVTSHELDSPLRPDLMTFNESRNDVSIRMLPTAQHWLAHNRPGTPIVKLKPEARRALWYIFSASLSPCGVIDLQDCYLDEGMACLPEFPATLKQLQIRNCPRPFPGPIAPMEETVSPSSKWLHELCHRVRFLRHLELVNCACSPVDIENLQPWMPQVKITMRSHGLPKILSQLEDAWKQQRAPALSVELVSRYVLLENPKWELALKGSLTGAIWHYIENGAQSDRLRIIPWAAVADIYGETGLVKHARVYLQQFPGNDHLVEHLSACGSFTLSELWNIITYLTWASDDRALEILDKLLETPEKEDLDTSTDPGPAPNYIHSLQPCCPN